MKLKNYVLIYNENFVLYDGDYDNMPELSINKDTTIESFDTMGETIKRREEVFKEIRAKAENPAKYYDRLLKIADEIEEIRRKIYRNIWHDDYVAGEINDFNDSLDEIRYKIKNLINYYDLGEEIERWKNS